uniref:Uncharacterized protein n=1 Tax=Glossina palpalis gambiensis TaxID=67801 RepID=A0A1B0AQW8_9MUSC
MMKKISNEDKVLSTSSTTSECEIASKIHTTKLLFCEHCLYVLYYINGLFVYCKNECMCE